MRRGAPRTRARTPPDEVEEARQPADVEQQRAGRGQDADGERERAPVPRGAQVLDRDGGRVDVGEALVALAQDEHGERQRAQRQGEEDVEHAVRVLPGDGECQQAEPVADDLRRREAGEATHEGSELIDLNR